MAEPKCSFPSGCIGFFVNPSVHENDTRPSPIWSLAAGLSSSVDVVTADQLVSFIFLLSRSVLPSPNNNPLITNKRLSSQMLLHDQHRTVAATTHPDEIIS